MVLENMKPNTGNGTEWPCYNAALDPHPVPRELNGYPVIAAMPGKSPGYMKVVVQRPNDHPHPFVVATWYPELQTRWIWGHYFTDLEAAMSAWRS